jgi:hypothetical protein
MKLTASLLLALAALLSPTARADDAKPMAGFSLLFNGKDFTGWKVPEGDNGHWKVVDGVIDYDAQSEAKGAKDLWTDKSYTDYVLRVDWRIKETPYTNPNVPYILPDGTHAKDIHGKEMKMSLPDSDSGVILRGNVRNQVNIWCWPIGSGEMYGWRMDAKQPPEVRAATTPKHQADKPVGQWNTYEITVKGETVNVVLNGVTVIDNARLPGIDKTGPVGLQHHGGMRDGKWNSPPALVQFRNIAIKELTSTAGGQGASSRR